MSHRLTSITSYMISFSETCLCHLNELLNATRHSNKTYVSNQHIAYSVAENLSFSYKLVQIAYTVDPEHDDNNRM